MIKSLTKKMITFAQQNKPPNYTAGNGKFYLVRCFNHPYPYNKRGIENYLPAVASGKCSWCGWSEKKTKKENNDVHCLVNASLLVNRKGIKDDR